MRLVIGINPIQKQPHDVIGNNSRAAGVGYQLHKKLALLVGVGNVPFAERFAYQSQVFSASNSLLYLLTKPFKSSDQFPKGGAQLLKFLLVFLQPFAKKRILLHLRLTRLKSGGGIEEWREKLARNPNSIAFFYFAGHGVKRERRDDVLLLDGFGRKSPRILKHAIDSTSLTDGMAPSTQFPNLARTQLYFFDACRVKPSLFKKYERMEPDPIWDKTEMAKQDDRSMLILYTTVAGAKAYGRSDDQSLFSRALIRCLDGAAAESSDAGLKDWSVTGMSLANRLQTQLDIVNQEYKSAQLAEVGKSPTRDFVLNRLETPPPVKVRLQIEPEAARAWAKIDVLDYQETSAWELPFPVKPLPHRGTLSAGMYMVRAKDCREDPEWASGSCIQQATPKINDWSIRILPSKKIS
jgi:hypothetical protein